MNYQKPRRRMSDGALAAWVLVTVIILSIFIPALIYNPELFAIMAGLVVMVVVGIMYFKWTARKGAQQQPMSRAEQQIPVPKEALEAEPLMKSDNDVLALTYPQE